MTWVKLDDHANEHVKQVDAGGAACWLWACGLMFCNRQKNKTGFIPSANVRTLYAGYSDAESRKLAKELVRAGLWEPADGGFLVHDYGEYQPTGISEARATAGRLGGLKSGEARRSKPEAIASSKHEAIASTEAKQSASESVKQIHEANPLARPRVGSGRDRECFEDGEVKEESGHDLARRLWDTAWSIRWGEPYTYSPTMGAKSDDRTLQRLGALARQRDPGGPEAWLASRFAAYMSDVDPWLEREKHPLRAVEGRLSRYATGEAAPDSETEPLDPIFVRAERSRRAQELAT